MPTDSVARAVTHPTVLIAEDHPRVVEELKRLLSRDFDVLDVVSSGEALVAAALRQPVDVIVTDVSLNGLDGISAARELRRRHCQVPIVVMSADDSPFLREYALESGASEFLSKSQLSMNLLPVLRRHLELKT